MRRFAIIALSIGAMSCSAPAPGPGGLVAPTAGDVTEARAGDVLDRLSSVWGDPYDDDRLTAYVKSVAVRVAARSQRPGLPWTVRVLDDPAPSAYASLGGYLYISRGMLAHLGSEAQLATVLGHEIAHVEGGHARESLLERVNLLRWTKDARDAAELDRDQEREADGRAVELMAMAGYDVREAVRTMERLARIEADLDGGASWEREHPIGAARVARVSLQANGRAGGEVGRERYAQAIDGLVVGNDERNGYVAAHRYVHPHLDVSIQLPRDFELTDAGSRAVGASADRAMGFAIWPMPAQRGVDMLAAFGDPVGPRRERNVGGASVVISSFEDGDGRGEIAELRGIDRALLIVVYRRSGTPGQPTALLDALLDSVRPSELSEHRRATPARIRMARADERVELGRFVDEHCKRPGEMGTIAALQGLAPTDVLAPGELVKCVE